MDTIKNLVRVTECLDWVSRGELLDWRGRVGNREANRISAAAKKRGTQVHEAIASTLLNQKVKKLNNEEAALGFSAWADWWKLQSIEGSRTVEQTLVDIPLGLTGTPDFHTSSELFDWKVSKAREPKWTWHWQCVAYLHLLGRFDGKYRIIQLHPEVGTWAEFTGRYSAERASAFLGLLGAYKKFQLETEKEEIENVIAD